MLLIETSSSSIVRTVPPEAPLARSKPPTVIGTLFPGTPFMEMLRASPPA